MAKISGQDTVTACHKKTGEDKWLLVLHLITVFLGLCGVVAFCIGLVFQLFLDASIAFVMVLLCRYVFFLQTEHRRLLSHHKFSRGSCSLTVSAGTSPVAAKQPQQVVEDLDLTAFANTLGFSNPEAVSDAAGRVMPPQSPLLGATSNACRAEESSGAVAAAAETTSQSNRTRCAVARGAAANSVEASEVGSHGGRSGAVGGTLSSLMMNALAKEYLRCVSALQCYREAFGPLKLEPSSEEASLPPGAPVPSAVEPAASVVAVSSLCLSGGVGKVSLPALPAVSLAEIASESESKGSARTTRSPRGMNSPQPGCISLLVAAADSLGDTGRDSVTPITAGKADRSVTTDAQADYGGRISTQGQEDTDNKPASPLPPPVEETSGFKPRSWRATSSTEPLPEEPEPPRQRSHFGLFGS
eukprot:TRINITY_DN21517_c0_g1_i1.p1 TRINITY_DN21517_c0_g1~~TRINITY_DN21517_c0_g1_i1.p1  ORF type:complete len:415 (+),score=55.51 TRINITY_DN21517_c0_g1_i1:100-1344(+)